MEKLIRLILAEVFRLQGQQVISRQHYLDRPVFQQERRKIPMEQAALLLMNTGEKPVFSQNGLVTTIAWGLDGKVIMRWKALFLLQEHLFSG